MPIRPRTMPQGTKLSEEWIPAGDLMVDSSYERPLAEKKVRKIIADFDPDLLGALLVSRRDDDTTYIIDGQHRCEAVVRSWGPREKLPCLVYHGLSVGEEARIFAGVNRSRTKPRPLDLHRADVIEGKPDALEMERILAKNGMTFGTTNSPVVVQAVSSVQSIFRSAGPETLDTTLRLVKESGVSGDESLPAEVLVGIGVLVARYGHLLNDARLRTVLSETIPRRTVSAARHRRADMGAASRATTLGAVVAEMLLVAYNRGRRSGRIAWEPDVTGTRFWLATGTFPTAEHDESDE